jgi:transposase InsO family protein
MDARYVADRSLLLALCQQHPDWTHPTLAQATGRSLAWVKQWQARFRAEPDNPAVIWGRPRARTSPTVPPVSARVIEQILAIRDHPPEHLQRPPGPRAILYYLPRAPEVAGERLPRSTRTIWKILRANARIARPQRPAHHPLERPEPLGELQLDCKDVVQVDPLATPKHAHAVEVFDAIDVGTSRWLMAEPSAAFTAETVFAPLLHLLQQIGVPARVRFDRDPRLWGSATMRDFPTPFLRFWYALGVEPVVNPPHRPDLNAFVERLHGTVEREYRQIVLPGSLETTRDTLPAFQRHYNTERPHQGLACSNRPPAVAFPQLPFRSPLPAQVDPDRWVAAYQDRCFARRVRSNGTVFRDDQAYYVGSRYAGRAVVAQLDAATRQVRFFSEQHLLLAAKPLRGLVGAPMSLEAFVTWCEQEARTLWRRYRHTRPRHAFPQAS